MFYEHKSNCWGTEIWSIVFKPVEAKEKRGENININLTETNKEVEGKEKKDTLMKEKKITYY